MNQWNKTLSVLYCWLSIPGSVSVQFWLVWELSGSSVLRCICKPSLRCLQVDRWSLHHQDTWETWTCNSEATEGDRHTQVKEVLKQRALQLLRYLTTWWCEVMCVVSTYCDSCIFSAIVSVQIFLQLQYTKLHTLQKPTGHYLQTKGGQTMRGKVEVRYYASRFEKHNYTEHHFLRNTSLHNDGHSNRMSDKACNRIL